jgi:hypothetical protein
VKELSKKYDSEKKALEELAGRIGIITPYKSQV